MTTKEAIENTMRRFPAARQTAVENVAISWSKDDGMANALNLEQDRRLYGWSMDTVHAIRHVMTLLAMPH